MIKYLRQLFDTSDKDVKNIQPTIDRINALEAGIQALSDEELANKTQDFKAALQNGTKLDALLPEAFAVVREVSRRTLGMRQFDVQLVGGVVLHQGRIAEMKTGEGKTLVGVAPLYLNALSGKGAHLVTANDFLARRDAVWMGPIYHFLGVSVGIIQGHGEDESELGGSYIYDPGYDHDDPRYYHMRPCSRREAYLQDIVYGTNHEFGFDYLRDNMAFEVEQLSMRELNYAIVDEVDSILIDEARTPHIISGPSNEDVSIYQVVDGIVRQMQPEVHWTADKKNHSANFTEEGMDMLEENLSIENIALEPRLFHHATASVKAYALFEKDVDYVVKGQEILIVDQNTGRAMPGRRFSDGLHQALEAKEGVRVQHENQTVAVITFQNLFRMYEKLAGMTGTAKTEEDEFRKIYGLDVVAIPTHRDMVRKDNEDIVYKSQDMKFRGITREILRLYSRQQPVLVGTRSIEMTEVVSGRLTPDSLQRTLFCDMLLDKMTNDKGFSKDAKKDVEKLFQVKLEELKMNHVKDVVASAGYSTKIEDLMDWFLSAQNLGSECREYLEEAVKHGVPHNVLNAKYHEREALIISEAGRKGAVTISTNMAGRGVDILLGGRVEDESVTLARKQEVEDGGLAKDYADTFMSFRRGGKERAAPPLPLDDTERRTAAEEVRALGGLYILGTERHESRRIDNQLRGRAGRQGDPGESRFYVSLEDHLWKIFNSKMMENPMLKAWPEHEEVKTKMITSIIHKTQERIENHFFEARKHVLEYDDVLNSQRETIYGMRREILLGKDYRNELKQSIREYLIDTTKSGWFTDEEGTGYASDEVYERLNEVFPLVDQMSLTEFEELNPGKELDDAVIEAAMNLYDQRVEDYGDDIMKQIERHVMLRSVNDQWMSHLQMMDYIREGISLRSYGQTDPLVAYKKETFDLFNHTLKQIRDQSVQMVYSIQVRKEDPMQGIPEPEMQMMRLEDDSELLQDSGGTALAVETKKEVDLLDPRWKTLGRNELCLCGSGKKFKNCHYPILREKGII
ncbi:MAG: SEC-C domain-containing protein [Fimbriimonadaceae bacterium]|jgi:preprotein translocase subunit SecA|nr:SEC-C domain-containing protein [Fimbriimonadaceae bacterium]